MCSSPRGGNFAANFGLEVLGPVANVQDDAPDEVGGEATGKNHILEKIRTDRTRKNSIKLGKLLDTYRGVDTLGKIPQDMQRYSGADPGEQVYLAGIAELLLRGGRRGRLAKPSESGSGIREPPKDGSSMRKDLSALKSFAVLLPSIRDLFGFDGYDSTCTRFTNFVPSSCSSILLTGSHNTLQVLTGQWPTSETLRTSSQRDSQQGSCAPVYCTTTTE
jgi:hypothetical protein